jgi:arylformamidase
MSALPPIDITRPLHRGMPVWPGDTPFVQEWTQRISRSESCNTSAITLSTHAGTHVDAPLHVLHDGEPIARCSIDRFIGPARVVHVLGVPVLDAELIRRVLPEALERVLFRTGCWTGMEGFPRHFPALTREAAHLLVDAGVRLVGTDAPSVDEVCAETLPAHRVLLAAGIPIIENLLLDQVSEGEYWLVALPLRLESGDASPVRAVLFANGESRGRSASSPA